MVPMLNGKSMERQVPSAAGNKSLYNGAELYAFIHGQYKNCIPEKGEEMMLFDLEFNP